MSTDVSIPVLGIDLGTTNSCIARINPNDGSPEIITNREDKPTTPSVVFFEDNDTVIVGESAKNAYQFGAELICEYVKRKMGQKLDIPYVYHGKEYSPEAISAVILRGIVGDALEQLEMDRNSPVRAVITVPAYFNSVAKNATLQAGVLAGIDVLELAHEPVAAALSYGFGRTGANQNLLVYDLGGGTFDVAVVSISEENTAIIATGGDRLLGGRDWDEAIVSWVEEQFRKKNPEIDFPQIDQEPELKIRLFEEAKRVKESLTNRKRAKFNFHWESISFGDELNIEEFEDSTSHLLLKTITSTKEVVKVAQDKGVQIDKIIMVGGSSLMPQVHRALFEEFNIEPVLHNPNLAVAKGAAILANLIEEGKHLPDVSNDIIAASNSNGELSKNGPAAIVNVASHGLGLQVRDPQLNDLSIVDFLIPKNTSIPASAQESYSTRAGQDNILLKIFEEGPMPFDLDVEDIELPANVVWPDNADLPKNCTLLHETPIKLPGELAAGSEIEVVFSVDSGGVLHVRLREPISGEEWEVKVDNYSKATESEKAALKKTLESIE